MKVKIINTEDKIKENINLEKTDDIAEICEVKKCDCKLELIEEFKIYKKTQKDKIKLINNKLYELQLLINSLKE